MKVKTCIQYQEKYKEPRQRLWRYKNVRKHVFCSIKELDAADVKLAFHHTHWAHSDNEWHIYQDKKGRLWKSLITREVVPYHEAEKFDSPLAAIIYSAEHYSKFYHYVPPDTKGVREETVWGLNRVIGEARSYFNQFRIIGGKLYKRAVEPMYRVVTFGLGNNHGGTGFFVEEHPCKAYMNLFNIRDFKKAQEFAVKTAQERGDTESIPNFLTKKPVEVFV